MKRLFFIAFFLLLLASCGDNTNDNANTNDNNTVDEDQMFSVPGDSEKTVVDSLTHLEWQQTFSHGTWGEAGTYCDTLSYGGHTDWRLPTIEELSTLPYYGKYSPAIDLVAFPGTPSGSFWSSTVYAHNTDDAWVVYFNTGSAYNYNKLSSNNIRCVRGNYDFAHTFSVSTVSGDTVVTDSTTGLMWQQTIVKNKTWKEALDYCKALSYAGQDDWRLPDINELKTIVDYNRHNAATDSSLFPQTPSDSFWSATAYKGLSTAAWSVNFADGRLNYDNKTNGHYVRCVR